MWNQFQVLLLCSLLNRRWIAEILRWKYSFLPATISSSSPTLKLTKTKRHIITADSMFRKASQIFAFSFSDANTDNPSETEPQNAMGGKYYIYYIFHSDFYKAL